MSGSSKSSYGSSSDSSDNVDNSVNTLSEPSEDIVHSTSSVSPSDIESENPEESSDGSTTKDQSETSEDNSHGSSYGSSSKTDKSSKSENPDSNLKETSDDIIHSTSSVSPIEFKSRGLHVSDISKIGDITINTKQGGRWHTERIKNQGNSKQMGFGRINSKKGLKNDIRRFTSNIIKNIPRGKFSRSWSTNWSSGSKGGGPKSYSRSWSTNWSSGSKGGVPKTNSRSWSMNWSSGSKGGGSNSFSLSGLNKFKGKLEVGDSNKISGGSYGKRLFSLNTIKHFF